MIDTLTPLIAIDAVALDTETTGLDTRAASVIEIGAVRIVTGVLRRAEHYRSFVRPLGPIDPEAADIHGIRESQLQDAPAFEDVWHEFATFAGNDVLIGHTIGFDLAILERQLAECRLAWQRPRMLDTQLLAQLASPELAKCSLDDLAARFKIEADARHSALGDAEMAAKVFLALVPMLQRSNIRTLQEAEAACRTLSRQLDDYRRANWVEPIAPPPPPLTSVPVRRQDLYAYRHRVFDLMNSPACFVKPDLPFGDALSLMLQNQISSVFVCPDGHTPRADRVGIVTERDVLRVVSARRSDAFGMQVSRLMSTPLVTVSAEAFAYVAIARMRRLRIRHLGVVDEQGGVIGALSARDLLRQHGEPAILVGDEVEQAEGVQSLSKAWAKLRLAVAAMMSDLPARDLAGLISQVLCDATARAAVLAERTMEERGLGAPPCAYAVAVLGSAGRGESLLAADQDHALMFASGEPDGPEDRWFAALGSEMADILHAAGIPYCAGGVMSKNAAWRGSIATWERRIESWINHSSPQTLLSVDIFFDMKPVYGDASPALALWRGAFERARDNAGFAKLLVEASDMHVTQGLNWFGRLKTVNGRIDLKRAGTFALVTAARALAIRHHIVERSTFARFASLQSKALGHDVDLGRFEEAMDLFLKLVLRQQVADMGQGQQPANSVAVQALSRFEREQLREALASVEHVNAFVRDLLFARG